MSSRLSIVAVVSILLFGCSSSPATSTNPDASAQGADAIRKPGCPDVLPTEGTPCTAPAPTCEYGDDPHCRTFATCGARTGTDFRWILQRSEACTPNGAACPAAFTDVPNGAACPIDASCTYPEGRCGCHSCSAANDGGPTSPGGEWECKPWMEPAGCPAVEPLIGTACSDESLECAYAPACCALVEVGKAIRCSQGFWTDASLACDCAVFVCGK